MASPTAPPPQAAAVGARFREPGQSFEQYVARKPVRPDGRRNKLMFSMEHCTSHECVMNGSNSREELDRQREMLCPVCLRKLRHALGDRFDVLTREEALLAFHRAHGQGELAHWTERRLEQLRTAVTPPEKAELRYPRP